MLLLLLSPLIASFLLLREPRFTVCLQFLCLFLLCRSQGREDFAVHASPLNGQLGLRVADRLRRRSNQRLVDGNRLHRFALSFHRFTQLTGELLILIAILLSDVLNQLPLRIGQIELPKRQSRFPEKPGAARPAWTAASATGSGPLGERGCSHHTSE
jgi:hypothetical protein